MEAMSWSETWSDDKRCLYCGTKLPLHRRVSDEPFCSDSHKRSFRIEQDQLALARLQENHQVLYGHAASDSDALYQYYDASHHFDDVSREVDAAAHGRGSGGGPSPNGRGSSVALADAPLDDLPSFHDERSPADRPQLDHAFDPRRPSLAAPDGLALLSARLLDQTAAAAGDEPALVDGHFSQFSPALTDVAFTPLQLNPPVSIESDELFISLCALPLIPVSYEPCAQDRTILTSLPRPVEARERGNQLSAGLEPEPAAWSIVAPVLADQPISSSITGGSTAQTEMPRTFAGPRPQPLAPAASSEKILSGSLAAEWPAELDLALPAELQAGTLAEAATAGCVRQPLPGYQQIPAVANSISPVELTATFLPAAPLSAFVLEPWTVSRGIKLLPVSFRVKPSRSAARADRVLMAAYPSALTKPQITFQTVCPETDRNRLKGALAFWNASRGSSAGASGSESVSPSLPRLAADFWQNAPRDLKLLAIGIPILLALAFHPPFRKIHSSVKPKLAASSTPAAAVPQAAPVALAIPVATSLPLKPNSATPAALPDTAPDATAGSAPSGDDWKTALLTRFATLRQTVAQRAGVELNDDFRSGLEDWETEGEPSATLAFDRNGFVRPAGIALYRPSLGLKDYDMEFLGLIDKAALSWVVRARDFRNYYAVKLTVAKDGPAPVLRLVRYPVIDGRAGQRVETPVRLNVQRDTLYRVGMNVHDDTFLLTVQGNVVDSWSDATLQRGGVGFFSAAGEASRVRWVEVSHQYDMLGRLCAYLAPYDSQPQN